MARFPPPGTITPALLASLLLLGCGFGDLFRAPGPSADVVFVFRSDTVVTAGDTIPLDIAVVASGDTLFSPKLEIQSTDTTLLTLNATGDSLIGVRQGFASLEVRLVGSIITGPAPDTVHRIRVRP